MLSPEPSEANMDAEGGEAVARIHDLVIGPSGGGRPTVEGVGFELAPGEVLGISGRSGSGKTTVALSLLGHLRPGLRLCSGTVRVAGLDPFTPAGARLLRGRRVAFLGQDPAAALNPARRLGSLLGEAVGARTPLRGRAVVAAEVARLLLSVQLPSDRAFLRRYVHQVSGGQAQRVALALTLAGSPELLVLDEPTGALDTVLAQAVRALLGDLLQRCSAVLVSHDAHLLAALADRTLVLQSGRVVAMGHPEMAEPRGPMARPAAAAAERPGPTDDRGLLGQRLRASHGDLLAVDEVTLAPEPGGCLAVVGPSGSGKSTLARCLVGLHARIGGSLTLDGAPLAPLARHRTPEQRRGIQLVAQDSVGALNPRETVHDALARPMMGLRGIGADEAGVEISLLLDRVQLPAALAHRRPGSLSGGERQRVNLARALAAAPRVVVADEITSALDPEVGQAVLDLLDELRRTLGLTVVLVTHDLDVVARCSDHVLVLDAGRVVESGATDSVLGAPQHRLTRRLVECAPGLTPTVAVAMPPSGG